MGDLKQLKARLDTMCVFRGLTEDGVLSRLCRYLENPTVTAYADFVSALYQANGGDLGAHVRSLCEDSDNIYVRTVGQGKPVPPHLADALTEELTTLDEVAALTPDALRAPLDYDGFLPAFASGGPSVVALYRRRIADIGRYGYGVYANNRMFYVDEGGSILPVAHPDPVSLSDLVDYERERQMIIDNTRALLRGGPAANILLTGDAGTGKSSTIKAVGNALFEEGLRIVEVRKDQLRVIPAVLGDLAANPLKFILFIDDLSFLKDDDHFNALKAVLEGSVAAKSRNVVIYATGNRRHLVKESFSEREGDDIHRNDTVQELISLSERFGLHITFSKPNKESYLHMVRHMAASLGVAMPQEELEAAAERYALERGGRSARVARQFTEGLAAQSLSR